MEYLLFTLIWLLGSFVAVMIFYLATEEDDDFIMAVFVMVSIVGSWLIVLFELFFMFCYWTILIIKKYKLKTQDERANANA